MDKELPVWEEMTYDEQRAFLGLKDIRGEIAWQRLNRAVGQFAAAFRPVAEAWGRAATQITEHYSHFHIAGEDDPDSYGLAGGK